MKPSQFLGVILCVVALTMLYLPGKGIDPFKPSLDPSLYALQSQVKTAMTGPTASKDAVMLENVLRAAANCFVNDEKRPSPYYKSDDDLKWAIRSIGDISAPLGWRMSERYPELGRILSNHMEEKVGSNVDRGVLIKEMRNLADVLATI